MKQVITFIFMVALSSFNFAQESNLVVKEKKTGDACATPELERGKEDANLTRGKNNDTLMRGKQNDDLSSGARIDELSRGKNDAPLERCCWDK